MLFQAAFSAETYVQTWSGTIRDIYLEKKYYNAVLILAIIATEGVLYHLLVGSGVITTPFFGCYC